MKRRSDRRIGFSMMEVMAVMAIISIVTGMVLPAVNNFNSGMRVTAAAEIFVQSIRQAKYRAMQEQGVHRLIFNSDRSYYKIQTYTGDIEGSPLEKSTARTTAMESDYDSIDWESITDTDEIELDSGVTVNFEAGFPAIVYFWVDGTLVKDTTHLLTDGNRTPIGESTVSFVYGSAAIRVVINALGVLSSEAYNADDDTNPLNDEVLW